MNAPRVIACPRCGAPTRLDAGNEWRPFCSERCKLIDLGGWFAERHGIPAEEPDDLDRGDEDTVLPRQ